jgi:putative FmdB family regulatory protein
MSLIINQLNKYLTSVIMQYCLFRNSKAKNMPIYDYQCSDCGFKQEVMRKVSASSIEDCPKCGKTAFAKQLSAPSFQLSGSGWYATDFKDKKTNSSAKSDSVATETETKPAACGSGCACH